jgi:predicted acetyltransferase
MRQRRHEKDDVAHRQGNEGATIAVIILSGPPRDKRSGSADMPAVTLVKPSLEQLPAFAAALRRGWSPDNVRKDAAAREQLERIARDAVGFVASLDDPHAMGDPIRLPDGSLVPRLPGYYRWVWDGEFCGSIGFRWQNGTADLPAHVLGHVGFSIVPWKQRRGYARQALTLLLPDARERGLAYIELTTDPDNIASQRVIQACGGTLVERFRKTDAYGAAEGLRFRIDVAAARRHPS